MSIDSRVKTVVLYENGGGRLDLIDRPAGPDGVPGIRGISSLYFDYNPEEVTALNGLDVWGGDNSLMLGDVQIAKRTSYTKIVFEDRETFIRAVQKFNLY